MNEYKGYTLTDITINSDISLTGKIYYGVELKLSFTAINVGVFLQKFHQFVDDDIAKQSELTNCQNFANELVELCKKYKVKLTTDNASFLYVNGRHLRSNVDIYKPCINSIDSNTEIGVL
jgi:hypothetical protein